MSLFADAFFWAGRQFRALTLFRKYFVSVIHSDPDVVPSATKRERTLEDIFRILWGTLGSVK